MRMQQMQQNYPAPPYPQRAPRAPMGNVPGGFQGGPGFSNVDQQQQYMQQGLKVNQQQNSGVVGVMQNAGPGGQMMGQTQNVMGPPHASLQHQQQQQIMQSVRSPPPIRSPQPTPSPRSTQSPRAQQSPRPLPSPHPQQPGDLHNHMHPPHQSPLPGPDGVTGVGLNMGNLGGGIPNESLTAQDQLTKFVERL